MYCICKRKGLYALFILILVALILLGFAVNVIPVSVATRQLPIYSVETDQKRLALGVNCAWDDSDIDRLLELFDRKGIRATFFLVGDWCDQYPDAVKKIAAAGHELGSHSNSHPDMTRLDRDQIARELSVSQEKIAALSGVRPTLFRAPSGAYDDLVVSTARSLGWEVIQWSNDSLDWKTPPVGEMVERVCGRAAPGDIMLWHAGKKNTAAALELVIDRLKGEGYQFVAVGELIYPAPYTLDHTGRQHRIESDSIQ